MNDSKQKINLLSDLCLIEFLVQESYLQQALFYLEKLKQDVKNGEVVA